jgi:hypothetical protein
MPTDQFLELTLLPKVPRHSGGFSIYETLVEPLEKIDDLQMTQDEWKLLRREDGPGTVDWCTDLLKGGLAGAVDPSISGHRPEHQQVRHAGDLVALAGMDDPQMVMFWPNSYYRKKLYRWNDDLDYVVTHMHPMRAGKEWAHPTDELHSPLVHNPYGYANDVQIDGVRAEWPGPFGCRDYPEYAPAPPKQLVWWLDKLQVLSKADAMKLRPYLCRWWA